jgi:hypothetical protein
MIAVSGVAVTLAGIAVIHVIASLLPAVSVPKTRNTDVALSCAIGFAAPGSCR